MRKEHQGTYQMLWDCQNCGTKKLLGITHRHCPHCGAPQDPRARYFPSDEDKVAVEDHVYTGADWSCAACDTPNSARADFCMNCGIPREGNREVKRRSDQLTAERQAFSEDSAKSARSELVARPSGPPDQTPSSSPQGNRAARFVIAGIVVVVALIAVVMFWKKEAAVAVTGHSWSRVIQIETFKPVRESAWRDQMPRNAYDATCSQEVRSHKKIPDGEECRVRRIDKGDGSFDEVKECTPKFREEPVYDTKCSFNVDKWVPSREVEASGRSLEEKRHWPEVALARTGNCLGCERQGRRTESYVLYFKDTGDASKRYECTFPEARWAQIPVGSRWASKVGVLSGKLDCDALQPVR